MTPKKLDLPALIPSWFRKVVPQGYSTGTIRIEGTSPLLMNSADADRFGPTYRAYQTLATKTGRTEDDDHRLAELEWALRIYLDADIGPYIPGANVKRLLADAAGKYKKGATVERSLITIESRIPLEYEGPRDQDGLWAAGYRYTTMVKNAGFNGGRVMRTRPMFPTWAVTVAIAWDAEEIDPHTLELIVERSQRYGLGDYRPAKGGDFGAFRATLDGTRTSRAKGDAKAAKDRNGHDEAAHLASVERLTEPVI